MRARGTALRELGHPKDWVSYPRLSARSAEKSIGIRVRSWNPKFFDDRPLSWLSRGMQTTATSSVIKSKPTMGCGYVVFVILMAGGVGLLAAAANDFQQAGGVWRQNSLILVAFGSALLLGATAYLKLAKRLVREGREEAERRAQFPGKPWKWKKKWQQPVIEANAGSSAAMMWFFAIFWNAISIPGAWIVAHDHHAPKAASLIYLFPLVGLGLLSGAIYQTVRWRKFGRTRFVPSSLPGAIGGYLGGMIEVPARVVPEGEAKLQLKCVRRETRGSGKSRSTTDNVLWEHEELIARDKWMTGLGGTQIPVLFYIPPECTGTDDSDSNNEVVWRLSAEAAVPGVDFATQFDVPVFATGETATPPATGQPLLAEYSSQPLDAAALKNCGVRREGNTFYFSASHLPGTKLTTAGLTLGILGLLVWFWGRDIHGVIWAVTIFFGLIISLFAVSVWCDQFELRLEGGEVVVTKPRPWGTTITRVRRDEVRLVKHAKSMSSGENQYFGLSLVGVDGVDPMRPRQGEPFLVRKLRYQLQQSQKKGDLTPEKLKEFEEQIAAQFNQQAKFVVPFAAHIPGQTKAEAIAAQVLAAIRGEK